MAQNNINLTDLFGAAASALSQNQGSLNQADTYNQNHGDNMVQIFNLITQAIADKPNASPSDQLAHASREVKRQTSSGSAQVYAGALQTASRQMEGQPLNQDTAMELITSLLGGGQTAQPAVTQQGTDLVSALLGSFAGDSTPSSRQAKADQGGSVIDTEDLMRGGMAYMNAQQHGASGTEALMDALIAGSPLGESPQRAQSAKLVGTAILGAVTAYAASKKADASKSTSKTTSARKTSTPSAKPVNKKSPGIKRKARP
jgi:hypothetical protein